MKANYISIGIDQQFLLTTMYIYRSTEMPSVNLHICLTKSLIQVTSLYVCPSIYWGFYMALNTAQVL